MTDDDKPKRTGRPPKTLDTPLNEKQLAFASGIVQGMSAADAARYAGYQDTKKTPHVLMRDPRIERYVRQRRQEVCRKFEITEATVVNEIAKVAFSNVGDLIEVNPDTGKATFNFTNLTPEQRAAISRFSVDEYKQGRGDGARDIIKTNISQHDKLRALELLGKTLSLFTDNVKVSGTIDLVEKITSGRNRLARELADDE